MVQAFDKVDFDRGYLGDELKWPITYQELDDFRGEACEILEISSTFDDSLVENYKIKKIDFNFSPPVRFGTKYFDELTVDPLVHVFLNSNLVDVTHDADKLSELKVISYTDNVASIKADKFVFAMGGIENSRYLLWLKTKYGNSFISDTPALGRYWMEHPHFTLGQAIVDKRKVGERFYSLTAQAQKDNGILNCGFRVEHLNESSTKALIRDVLCVAPKLGQSLLELAGEKLVCGARFRAAWEQNPSYENRITLDTELDTFGIPKPILNWRKTDLDRKTIEKSIAEFNNWLLAVDGGRIQLDKWILNESDYPVDGELAGYHHMGGTRMHEDPRFGVVDSNCQVYGSKNLFIAGSSVFSTGGHANPTLPIVQFAIRLAYHLSS
jgi:hypothetical protein